MRETIPPSTIAIKVSGDFLGIKELVDLWNARILVPHFPSILPMLSWAQLRPGNWISNLQEHIACVLQFMKEGYPVSEIGVDLGTRPLWIVIGLWMSLPRGYQMAWGCVGCRC